MKITPTFAVGIGALAFFAFAETGSAQNLYADNFDGFNSGFFWNTNLSPNGDGSADFAFDYSSLGIPSAPNSIGGTTIGLGFTVNRFNGVLAGISASPTDQHFTGDFLIRFDLWLNYVGPLPAGGNGSTQAASFGWGATGNSVQYSSSNNSILFAATSDGGSAQDYRVYGAAGGATIAPASGVYAAGTTTTPDVRNNTDPYYSSLGGKSAPSAQLALFPQQSGVSAAGTFGMAWHDIQIEKSGNTMTWKIDNLLIATVPLANYTVAGDNLTLGMFDINATSSNDSNNFLNAAIFDNVVVTVPEPSSTAMLGLATTSVLLRRRRLRHR